MSLPLPETIIITTTTSPSSSSPSSSPSSCCCNRRRRRRHSIMFTRCSVSSVASSCSSLFLLLILHTMVLPPDVSGQPPAPPSSPSSASSALTSGDSTAEDTNERKQEYVCSTFDVRNHLSNFKKLNDCTVVEGYVRIILIEHAEREEFQRLTFPKLREITGYLLLYRVYGLRSLTDLFPNLSVIRGQILFFNYALVIFEMPDLEEVGLHSLMRIVRGGVRMEKNAQLCYVDTVDWQRVASVKMADNFILQNKEPEECVNVCPKNKTDGSNICPEKEIVLNGEKTKQQLCWNADKCQKVCPLSCGSNNACYETNVTTDGVGGGAGGAVAVVEQRCCHAQCLGGCFGPLDTQCTACRNIFHEGHCITKCPPNTYEFRSRRCVTESVCRAQFRASPPYVGASSQKGSYWKMYDGKCMEECATGFTESKTDRSKCERCQGHCPKVCAGQTIDNIASAQRLKGCTIIEGVLEIQIHGGSALGTELEDNLGMIEEITHYLKIVRSYALVSLRFLRSLRLIRGLATHNNRYAMFILDNQNLQDLWDLKTHPNLTILNGTLFFHFNRKLCLSKIEELVDFVGQRDRLDSTDISQTSNGDQIACNIESVKVDVYNIGETHIIIRWTNFQVNDPRSLLSWVINYRKAPEENISIYSARDACGTDVWKTIDVKPDNHPLVESPFIASIIYNLEPFTKYAVYVQTYSIATAKVGAMSKVYYFTTLADMPSPVRDITVDAKYPGELHVTWKVPSSPNGNVTHYYVYWQSQSLAVEKFHQRNYCTDKLRLPGKTKETKIIPNEKNITKDGTCCSCPKTKAEIMVEESERRYQIEFENFLHNNIYRKQSSIDGNGLLSNILRKKRSATETERKARPTRKKKRFLINESDIERFASNHESYKGLLHNNSELPSNTTARGGGFDKGNEFPVDTHEAAIVYGKTEIILTNLKHFQEYNIEVIACHEYVDGMVEKQCSNRAIISGRTLANASADTVDERNITVTNVTSEPDATGVLFTWKEPFSPNGLVILYEIELFKADVPNFKPYFLCIPHQEYEELSGSYEERDIPHGTWTFRLRAVSLAGNGPWTDSQQFFVPEIKSSTTQLSVSLIIGVVIAMFISIIVILVIVGCVVRKKIYNVNMTERNLEIVTFNPNYTILEKEYVPDEWEVEREKIQIIRELGQGSFGMVYEGIATDISDEEPFTRVAIKTVNESASIHDRYSFLNEASIMKAFSSYHVVKLLGVVSKGQPVLVVMELMSNGDLKTFLRMRRPEEDDNDLDPPTLAELLKWAGEIADGMAYLSYIKYVHRDLAARNCMVSFDSVVKIGDFGMTRDVYATDYYRKGTKGLLPVRWMAPESLRDGVFSSRSDVWSYGVVVWEMATLAAQPYQGLSNEQVLHYVIDGSIMERPEGCPDKLYELMLECWQMNPKDRPTFSDIIDGLSPDLPDSFRDNSFYYTITSDDDSDNDDDFTSAGSHADAVKDVVMGGCVDIDADDSDLIHSKTPLHPAKSTEALAALDSGVVAKSRDPMTNSRGFLMPVRLPTTTFGSSVLPSPKSGRSISRSSVDLVDRTSVSDVGSRDGALVRRTTPTKQSDLPPYERDVKTTTTAETTNDTLSSLDRSSTDRRSPHHHRLFAGDSQPDVIRAGLLSSQDNNKGNSHSPHKNGHLVNGLLPPPYTYRTSPTC